MEELEVQCPDCGSVYAVKPEQAGKLLHCKCGRYLVAGSHDEEPAAEDETPTGEVPAVQQDEEPDYQPTQRFNVADIAKQAKPADAPKPPTPPPAPPKVEPPAAVTKTPLPAEDPSGYQRTERINVAALQGAKQQEAAKQPAAAPEAKPKAPSGPNIPPIETPVIGVKAQAPKPKIEEPHAETVFEPKAPASTGLDDKKKMMMGGAALGLVAIIGLGMMMTRSSDKPATSAPAKTPTAASQPASAPSSTGAQANNGGAGSTTPAAATTTPGVTGACPADAARLDNGAVVARSLLGSGMGKLEIENQTPSDISARLVNDGDLTIAWVYIQQGKSVTIPTVPLGAHKLRYSAGSDWDAQSLTFKCNASYAEWDKALEYSERRVDDRSFYGDKKVTLGKGKNPPTISKDDFFKGHIGLGSS